MVSSKTPSGGVTRLRVRSVHSLTTILQDREPRNTMAKRASTTAAAARRGPASEPIATGVFAFEGDWESDLRDPWSIEPVLRTLQVIGELKCIRRNVATVPELGHYLDKRLHKRYADYQVGCFGFHGGPGSLWLGGKRCVSLEDLEARIDGRAQGRIIGFGSCSVMGVGEPRLKAFTATSATSSASSTSTEPSRLAGLGAGRAPGRAREASENQTMGLRLG